MTAIAIRLALRHRRAILAAALIAALWWWHAGQLRAARVEGDTTGRAAVQQQWDAERESMRQAAATAERENRARKEADDARVITAQSDRAQAAARDAAALAGVSAERDRLRHSLATALNTIRRCDLPSPAADAASDRAAAVESVFDEMARAAEGLARAADGHAADSLMYQRAWPR